MTAVRTSGRSVVLAVGVLGVLVASLTACQPTNYSQCPTAAAGQVRVAVVGQGRAPGTDGLMHHGFLQRAFGCGRCG